MKPNHPGDVWKFIAIGASNECWPFTGKIFTHGYGRFCFNRKSHSAHKFVYRHIYGEVGEGQLVMHKCNNKICCNPNHLILGSNSENQRHASSSGAFPLGRLGIRGVR